MPVEPVALLQQLLTVVAHNAAAVLSSPYSLSGLLIGLACTSMAVWVYLSSPASWLNRLWSTFCLAVSGYGFGCMVIGLAGSAEQSIIFCRLTYIGVVFIPSLFYHFVVASLNLHRPKSLAFTYLTSIGFLIADATPLLVVRVSQLFHGLYYVTWPVGPLWPLFVLFFVGMTCLSMATLWRSIRQGKDRHRRVQAKWMFAAGVVGYVGGLSCFLPAFGVLLYPYGNFLVPLYPVIMSYAIVRHGLMDIRIVIRRSVVYSTLIALITAAYLVMVLVMEKGFQGFFGYRSVFATGLVAFVIAIFFNPLRTRIQWIVDRALFKGSPPELADQREQLLVEVRRGEQMKAVATLAAGLAHEIKNPLASIKTFTEYLDTRYEDPAFRAKFHKIVGGEVERIHLIVQQLLDFAKPMPPKLEPVDLPRLLDETIDLLNNELVQHYVDVSRHYQGQGRILGDPQQLKQVFLNLFLNSLQAMNGHGRLEVRAAAQHDELVVTVADDGSGISAKDLPHVFDPFFTTKAEGTGLGLAVVQSIIQEHAGRVTVESQSGQGTQVRLFLPLATTQDL